MTIRRLLASTTGATAAEFALVLPLLLILLFSIIDGGRLLWTLNRAEKATQMGVRYAAVTRMVPSLLADYKFATGAQVTQVPPGTPVPTGSWAGTTCTATACTNSGAGPTPGFDSAAFIAIGNRVRLLYPEASNARITISYQNSGLGYSGDPYGPDVAPEITLAVSGLQFVPLTSFSLATFTLPTISATMTMEDGVGTVSN